MHYVALINYATRTGETTELEQLAGRRCESCATIVENIREIYSAGGSIESRGWRLTAVSLVPQQPSHQPILDLGVVESPETVTQSADGPVKRFKGGKQPMTMYLRRTADQWRVERLDLVP
jgi:hypothetical protein